MLSSIIFNNVYTLLIKSLFYRLNLFPRFPKLRNHDRIYRGRKILLRLKELDRNSEIHIGRAQVTLVTPCG